MYKRKIKFTVQIGQKFIFLGTDCRKIPSCEIIETLKFGGNIFIVLSSSPTLSL
jgi:hypothetical protein